VLDWAIGWAIEFQFLIGTLKTLLKAYITLLFGSVSIPYRYSKNTSGASIAFGLQRVSIPYRYSKNCASVSSSEDKGAFQFLIGTLKTIVFGS